MRGLPVLVMLAQLRNTGATHIYAEYEGGGDSCGDPDVVKALDDDDREYPIPPEFVEPLNDVLIQQGTPNTGWWNDAGGKGTIDLDLRTFTGLTEHIDFYDEREPAVVFTLPPPPEHVAHTIRAHVVFDGEGQASFDVFAYSDDFDIVDMGVEFDALHQWLANLDEKDGWPPYANWAGQLAIRQADDSYILTVEAEEEVRTEEPTLHSFTIDTQEG